MPEHRNAVKQAVCVAIIGLAGCAGLNQPPATAEPAKFPCSSEEGYWQGRAGLPYTGWCTPGTAPAFLSSHERGRELYELYRRRAMLETEISRSNPADVQRVAAAREQARQISELIRRLEASPR